MSSSKNLEYKKTSFLSKSNSAFIEQMYLKFINRDSDLPESWKKYFLEIGEELEVVAKEINGPSWNPINKKVNLDIIQENLNLRHHLDLQELCDHFWMKITLQNVLQNLQQWYQNY